MSTALSDTTGSTSLALSGALPHAFTASSASLTLTGTLGVGSASASLALRLTTGSYALALARTVPAPDVAGPAFSAPTSLAARFVIVANTAVVAVHEVLALVVPALACARCVGVALLGVCRQTESHHTSRKQSDQHKHLFHFIFLLS